MDKQSLVIRDAGLRDRVVANLTQITAKSSTGSINLSTDATVPTRFIGVDDVFLAFVDAGLKESLAAVQARLAASDVLDNARDGDNVDVSKLVDALAPASSGNAASLCFAKPSNLKLIGYGEAMIRLAPLARGDTDVVYGRGSPSGNAA